MTALLDAPSLSPATRDDAQHACAHCGQPIPSDRDDAYCCRGCKAVAGLISRSGLTRYYDLRRGSGVPIAELPEGPRDRKWLEELELRRQGAETTTHVAIDLQGVHCTACVWLLQTLFERDANGDSIEINPALGRADLRVGKDFPLARFLDEVEAFGYRVGPSSERGEAPPSDGLLVRAGIALALAGNGMMLSAAIHLGLRSGDVYRWASHLSFGAATLAMLIGAPVFARSAWAGLRRGVLHLDLPIALGMFLAFLGSAWSYFVGGGANYVDTLTVFVALMLLGRWLQTRVLERNQRELLRDPGYDGILARRIVEGRAELVPCSRIEPGDELLLSPGDLVPVSSTLLDDLASFSFDWIDGESRPRDIGRDGEVPSGALLASASAVRVRANEAFRASEVWALLQGSRGNDDTTERTLAGLPKNVGGLYVMFVLVASAIAGAVSLLTGHDLTSALETTTAALVVTCPCAFGIAVPLAYEVVQSGLRRSGVFVRRPSVFERAVAITKVVFDKTGTLTTGRLALAEPTALAALDHATRGVLYDLASRSNHPKSRALATALETHEGLALDASRRVVEIRGRGLELSIDGHTHRLGAPRWAITDAAEAARVEAAGRDLVYGVDGALVMAFATEEQLRPEAREEVARLAGAGLDVFMLSGDRTDRCLEVGQTLGIPAERVLGDRSPEGKEQWVAENTPTSVLMIGDGLNDARALAGAGCSGTPSIERPFTASRCDFYFISPGLDPVTQMLRSAKRLAQVVRADLWIAFFYNLFAVALCIAGFMRPWLAAILMPASSLGTIAFTVFSLRGGNRRWTS